MSTDDDATKREEASGGGSVRSVSSRAVAREATMTTRIANARTTDEETRAGDDDDDDDDDDGDDDDDKGAAKVGEASTRGEGVDGVENDDDDIRAGDFVDKRKDVYKKRLCALFAMRETCSQLRRLLNGAFGEELFRRLFERRADAAWGESNAPATMLWRHKAWYLTKLGCQGCDKHATTRKPNWTFGVRMCKECLMSARCVTGSSRDAKHGTYEELTVGLPSDEVHGWSEFWRVAYEMTRFWKKSVKKRIALSHCLRTTQTARKFAFVRKERA